MQAMTRTRTTVAALSTVLVAAVLIAGTTLALTRDVPVAPPAANAATTVPMVGTPTGEFENGVPVYRLPKITVAASRSAELARMAQEEQLALKQARTTGRPHGAPRS